MDSAFQRRLSVLKSDYEATAKESWEYFFCPILYRDEEAELCRAHVINEGFQDADRSWTIQRKDVDNFYGSLFEADFLAMERVGSPLIEEALTDRNVSRQFPPELVLDEEVVEHYYAPNPEIVPLSHTTLEFHINDRIVPMALKLSPDEVEKSLGGRWQVRVEKDIRIPALVSLLKSAHLTLFRRLGYRYALSSAGYHLGREVLGEFFLEARGLERGTALEMAESHFRPYASAVRPLILPPQDFQGTLTDGLLLACGTELPPWALMVMIRFSGQLHSVIVPTLMDGESAALFDRFLGSPFPKIAVRNTQIHDDRFEMSPEYEIIEWPETNFDLPE